MKRGRCELPSPAQTRTVQEYSIHAHTHPAGRSSPCIENPRRPIEAGRQKFYRQWHAHAPQRRQKPEHEMLNPKFQRGVKRHFADLRVAEWAIESNPGHRRPPPSAFQHRSTPIASPSNPSSSAIAGRATRRTAAPDSQTRPRAWRRPAQLAGPARWRFLSCRRLSAEHAAHRPRRTTAQARAGTADGDPVARPGSRIVGRREFRNKIPSVRKIHVMRIAGERGLRNAIVLPLKRPTQ